MLFDLNQSTEPALQRQLDADRLGWSRKLQLETEGSFTTQEIDTFRMKGLFGEIPGSDPRPLRTTPRA